MFIELTDILRCPEPHDQQFLVLLPEEMAGRSVRSGRLGCPVCHREYRIDQGVVHLSSTPPPSPEPSGSDSSVDSSAIAAFLGLAGPGGYIATVGDLPGLDGGLVQTIQGVHIAAINPPVNTPELPMMSVLRSTIVPVKSRSLRGVVLGSQFGSDPAWISEAMRTVLPGLRIAGQGPAPEREGLNVLAAAGGWWVALI